MKGHVTQGLAVESGPRLPMSPSCVLFYSVTLPSKARIFHPSPGSWLAPHVTLLKPRGGGRCDSTWRTQQSGKRWSSCSLGCPLGRTPRGGGPSTRLPPGGEDAHSFRVESSSQRHLASSVDHMLGLLDIHTVGSSPDVQSPSQL